VKAPNIIIGKNLRIIHIMTGIMKIIRNSWCFY
jgi:hypothetical protein